MRQRSIDILFCVISYIQELQHIEADQVINITLPTPCCSAIPRFGSLMQTELRWYCYVIAVVLLRHWELLVADLHLGL